uniref:HAT C-terminal dimerisation domain-containing protein n=1 Tax=Amphimedon queenslandica TaxID=400682 RepID=A0A1X7SIR6_AMPQE
MRLLFKDLRCFDHNLDLAINKGLVDNRIDRAIRLCRKVVAAFSYSWKCKRSLREMQEKNNIPCKKLIADVSTRWSSTANMINRILKQKEVIRIVLGQDRTTSHLLPSWQDLEVLQCVATVITPFQTF